MPDHEEIMTPVAEGMVQLHEMFLSLVAGGFTEQQACMVLAGVLLGGSA